MATGFLVASAAVTVGGAVAGRRADKKNIAAQDKLAQENIVREEKETAESIRRTQEAQRTTLGTARTQAAGSGFALGSSLDKYVATVDERQARDIDWMRTSGASRTQIAEREAAARRSASESASKGSFVRGIGSSLGSAGGAVQAYGKYKWGF